MFIFGQALSTAESELGTPDSSNQALLAKLQELGSIDLRGDANTIGAHSMQLAVSMQQHFANPGGHPHGQGSSSWTAGCARASQLTSHAIKYKISWSKCALDLPYNCDL
ncbi:hypothetical protein HaLaN_31153 [Haematococcus lacustris]|uniref:Uncharacterized protein n=1 Tax=Haematococcus lacustris TaxID=44745 RepID=A0A6A0AJH2_HAELA|nr:hypothetical protein HaLaN_31153 [Haematococcus lacustris]